MARAPARGATSQALRRPRIERAQLRTRAASVTAAVNAGTKEFKLWYMVNIKKIRGNELTLAGVVKEDLTRSSSSPLNN